MYFFGCVTWNPKLVTAQERSHASRPHSSLLASLLTPDSGTPLTELRLESVTRLRQALLEYNCFPVEGIEDNSTKKEFFEAFWESGAPRLGEPGAKGWGKWVQETESALAEVSHAASSSLQSCVCLSPVAALTGMFPTPLQGGVPPRLRGGGGRRREGRKLQLCRSSPSSPVPGRTGGRKGGGTPATSGAAAGGLGRGGC